MTPLRAFYQLMQRDHETQRDEGYPRVRGIESLTTTVEGEGATSRGRRTREYLRIFALEESWRVEGPHKYRL